MAANSDTEIDSNDDFYIPDSGLVAAAEVALALGQPLLLTGEPGTGKSTFAKHLADHLAPAFFGQAGTGGSAARFPLHTFETKSTSVATDLFYRFDSLRRFHAVYDKEMSANNVDYITFEGLGRAILESLPWHDVSDLVANSSAHAGPRRSVVLIDEIDKAPRDFPNDLLNEIDQMCFRIPELTLRGSQHIRSVKAAEAMRPIVILTSNSEKNLPAPFLRRCIFHHIRFPDREDDPGRLTDIVHANLTLAPSRLSDSAIAFFYDIRDELQLDKLPTTSELVQWIRILHARSPFAGNIDVRKCSLSTLPPGYLKATLGVIGKTANDLALIEELADSRFGPDAGGE